MVLGLYAMRFAKYVESEEGRLALESIAAKKQIFKELLDSEKIEKISSQDLKRLFAQLEKLGANRGAELAESLIRKYGIENIRETLKFLVHADQTVEKRFEEALARFEQVPIEAIMEFLTYASPRDFCIWDETAKIAMRLSGQAGLHGLTPKAFTGPIGSWEYIQAVVALNHIREMLNSYLQRRTDFLDVYLFCLFLTRTLPHPV